MSGSNDIQKGDDGHWYVGKAQFDTIEEAYEFTQQGKTQKDGFGLWPHIATGVLVVFVLMTCTGSKTDPNAPLSHAAALGRCQEMLSSMSKDPQTAEVPYVGGREVGGEFVFEWGATSKPVRMKNSFGAMLSIPASCTINKSSKSITSLTLEGKKII